MENYYPSPKQIENLFAFLNDTNHYLTTTKSITQFIKNFSQSNTRITASFYNHQDHFLDFQAAFPRIIYILAGSMTAWIDHDPAVVLKAGTLIFANEDTQIKYESNGPSCKIVSIYLKRAFIHEDANFFSQSNGRMENYVLTNFGLLAGQKAPLILHIPIDSDANFAILLLSKFILANRHELIFPIFLWLLTDLNSYLPQTPQHLSNQNILQLIDRELNTITLDALAQKLGYSPSYTSKLIRKNFNTTFQAIVMEKKIERAQWILINTQESIHTISETVGFSDKSYFYKLFKKQTDLTPNQYRQQFSQTH